MPARYAVSAGLARSQSAIPRGLDREQGSLHTAEYTFACRIAISAWRARIGHLCVSLWAGRRAGEAVEEGRDVAAEQVGLLGGGEVAAAGHGCPPEDVVQALGPLAGRRAIIDELVGEDSDRGGHRDRVGGAQFGCQPPVVHVVPHGGRDRLGGPV